MTDLRKALKAKGIVKCQSYDNPLAGVGFWLLSKLESENNEIELWLNEELDDLPKFGLYHANERWCGSELVIKHHGEVNSDQLIKVELYDEGKLVHEFVSKMSRNTDYGPTDVVEFVTEMGIGLLVTIQPVDSTFDTIKKI